MEKIDKTLFYPKEGFGLTNFEKISLSNRPDFSKASFVLSEDTDEKDQAYLQMKPYYHEVVLY